MTKEENHMEQQFKSGFVALIGRPNVGKSTLMNRLIGQKIAITSNKPQTTRNRIQTVYTDGRGQIVFLDTPGMHQAKNRLGEYMAHVTEDAIHEVDLILWLVEPGRFIGAGERKIAADLAQANVPVLLIINKTDRLKRPEILKYIDDYRKLMEFDEIIPVSALTGDNLEDVVDTVFAYLPYGPMYFDRETVTDQPMRQIVAEMIREKALHALNEEVPHGIAVTVERMRKRKDSAGKKITDIEATIVCEKKSHKGIIIGKGGEMLKKIGSNARFEIERALEGKANLKLWVKVKKDWRDSDYLLKNFGYQNNER